jgi:hypothetical protein
MYIGKDQWSIDPLQGPLENVAVIIRSSQLKSNEMIRDSIPLPTL